MKKTWFYLSLVLGGLFMSFSSLFADTDGSASSLVPIGAGLAIGLAAIGGTLSQGMAVKGSMEGVSRNPGSADKMFLMFILGLAFIEAQTIFAFVISFMILG